LSRPSKIDRLAPEIRAEIAAMRDRGATIDEILEFLLACPLPEGALPVRSGLGAHIQELDKLAERVRLGRAITQGIVRPLSDNPDSPQTRANIELMHLMVTKFLMAATGDGEGVVFNPKEAGEIAKTLNNLAMARHVDAKTTLELEEHARRERERDAAKEGPAKGAKEGGLSPERVKELQERVAGVRS
jgi:hypothetical protein